MFATKARAYRAFFEGVVDGVAILAVNKAGAGRPVSGVSYGGRKNCSRTTYIPLNISVMRKYLPALSKELSLLSSHRSFRGNRKPAGGGPAGVAERKADVEKTAAGYNFLDLKAQVNEVDRGLEDILTRDAVDAIVNGTLLELRRWN